MKPRLLVENRPILGDTLGNSLADTPNHVASVDAYWSTDMLGNKRPCPT